MINEAHRARLKYRLKLLTGNLGAGVVPPDTSISVKMQANELDSSLAVKLSTSNQTVVKVSRTGDDSPLLTPTRPLSYSVMDCLRGKAWWFTPPVLRKLWTFPCTFKALSQAAVFSKSRQLSDTVRQLRYT